MRRHNPTTPWRSSLGAPDALAFIQSPLRALCDFAAPSPGVSFYRTNYCAKCQPVTPALPDLPECSTMFRASQNAQNEPTAPPNVPECSAPSKMRRTNPTLFSLASPHRAGAERTSIWASPAIGAILLLPARCCHNAPTTMLDIPQDILKVTPRYRELFQATGLTPQSIFTDPRIVVWRSITERENGTLDLPQPQGQSLRLHVKRFQPARGFLSPAEEEARGIAALEVEGIPTAPLVAFGKLLDGRSFVITQDLAGFRAADKAVAAGLPFESLLIPTADLAARLHARGLHHRDLYLCHFFVGATASDTASPDVAPELRLIDAARVKRLPGLFTRTRWIVKDLAQFWYSTLSLPVTDDQRTRWLARYAQSRGLASTDRLRRRIERKVASIARHDRNLKAAQPTRNVSIPGG